MNNAHMVSGVVTNGGTASSRPVGSGIQKRKPPYAGQRQTRPQHQPRHQHSQQQPRLRSQQPPARRQQNRPNLQTNNSMHPDTPGIGLLTSRVHEAPGDGIDDVDFDQFITMPSGSSYSRGVEEQLQETADAILSTLNTMSELLRQILEQNQLHEDHTQDAQQDGTGEYVEGFDPGTMPY